MDLGMDLVISGHSTALYSSYWMVEPLGVLFDCGDGAASFFQQKGRAVKFIACSHPDRDHISGLPQFLQLNSLPGSPVVLYPEESRSFVEIREFIESFDSHASGSVWRGIGSGERIRIRKDWHLESFANRHLTDVAGGRVKSLSYCLTEDRKKLKPEFHGLSGPEIARLHEEKGESWISETVTETILTYSADTPREPAEFWRNPRFLIHEATFLSREEATEGGHDTRHSVLPEVLEMAAGIEGLEALILGHFSTRYEADEIREAIVGHAKRIGLNVPVFALLPGETSHDILGGEPVWGV